MVGGKGEPGHGLVAIDAAGELVQIDVTSGATTRLSAGALGGIPSNSGLAWSNASGTPVLYSPLVNFGNRSLATFDLAARRLAVQPLEWTVDYVQVDEH